MGPRQQRSSRGAGVGALAALALAAASAVSPLFAGQGAVYSAAGVRYEAVIGRLDDLFPRPGASSSLAGEATVLAIDATGPDGRSERLLVPRTDGLEREEQPLLVFEEATSSLFVLWLARGADERSHLLFDALDRDRRWADPVGVTRAAMAIERPPTMVVSRDSNRRTVVHLQWSAVVDGTVRSFYSPLVLFDGRYAGWNPIVDLATLDRHRAAPSEVASEVLSAGGVEPGVDLRSVVMAAPVERNGHLVTARSRALPLALVGLSDDARNHLIGVGGGFRRTPKEIADELADHLDQVDLEIHAGARAFLTRSARAYVLENADRVASTEELAAGLRRHLLEAGASLLGQEFEAQPEWCGLYEVAPDAADQTEPVPHVFELCRIRDRALPAVGSEEVSIRTSRDGGLVLVTWRDRGALWFRLGDETSWSEPLAIEGGADAEALWHSLGR